MPIKYVTLRTDNLPGSGTQADPWNGKYSYTIGYGLKGILEDDSKVQSGDIIILGAGCFVTDAIGIFYRTPFGVPKNFTLRGQGMFDTTIQLSKDFSLPLSSTRIIYGTSSYSTIQDLTFDCNWSALDHSGSKYYTAVDGVKLSGTNNTLRNVRCINSYSTGDSDPNTGHANEGFVLALSAGQISDGLSSTNLIEGCVVEKFLGVYSCAICVVTGFNNEAPTQAPPQANGIIRDCVVKGNPWISVAAGDNCTIINNTTSDCGHFVRWDSFTMRNTKWQGNTILNAERIVLWLIPTNDPMPADNVVGYDCYFENNYVTMKAGNTSPCIMLEGKSSFRFSNLLVSGNEIYYQDAVPVPSQGLISGSSAAANIYDHVTVLGNTINRPPSVIPSGTYASTWTFRGSLWDTVRTGTVMDFAGAVSPGGWLLCDGSTVSRATYAELYAALGGASSPYGQGDGSTTFNLPDCRGRVSAGKDDMGGSSPTPPRITVSGCGINGTTLGASGGRQSNTDVPTHSHAMGGSPLQGVGFGTSTAASGGARCSSINGVSSGGSFANVSTAINAGTASVTNVQPTIIFNKIIKY